MPDAVQPDDCFLIMQGVHRCLAAHFAGLNRVLAIVEDRSGNVLSTSVVAISQLWSPKESISRWDRNRDFHELIEIVRTAGGRNRLFPVFVQRVDAVRAARHTKLENVQVLTGNEEDVI